MMEIWSCGFGGWFSCDCCARDLGVIGLDLCRDVWFCCSMLLVVYAANLAILLVCLTCCGGCTWSCVAGLTLVGCSIAIVLLFAGRCCGLGFGDACGGLGLI